MCRSPLADTLWFKYAALRGFDSDPYRHTYHFFSPSSFFRVAPFPRSSVCAQVKKKKYIFFNYNAFPSIDSLESYWHNKSFIPQVWANLPLIAHHIDDGKGVIYRQLPWKDLRTTSLLLWNAICAVSIKKTWTSGSDPFVFIWHRG